MKQNSTDIRAIMERFYSGTATPEEIARAVDYFNSTEISDPSLKADRDIIMALYQPASDVKVPEGLEQRLLDSTVNRRKKKARILPWILSIGASAAVVALIVTTSHFGNGNDNGATIAAEIAEITDTTLNPDMIQEEETVEEPVVTPTETGPATEIAETKIATPKVKARVTAKKAKNKKTRQTEKPEYSKKERAAAKLSIELINRVLGKADIACANAEEVFMEIDETLNE